MPVYFNHNSKLFIPIFTNKLGAQTLPSGPELLHYVTLGPLNPQLQAQRYSPAYLNTLAGSQPKVIPFSGRTGGCTPYLRPLP